MKIEAIRCQQTLKKIHHHQINIITDITHNTPTHEINKDKIKLNNNNFETKNATKIN